MSGCPSAHHFDGSCHSNGSPESVSVPHPMRGKEREGCRDMMSEDVLYNRDNMHHQWKAVPFRWAKPYISTTSCEVSLKSSYKLAFLFQVLNIKNPYIHAWRRTLELMSPAANAANIVTAIISDPVWWQIEVLVSTKPDLGPVLPRCDSSTAELSAVRLCRRYGNHRT